jgi:UDP-glucose 4-epimerase
MILVTGGFGSIGAHTALALADLGEQVVVTRHRKAAPPSFLEGRVAVERADLADLEALRAIGDRHEITGIVHLAAVALEEPDAIAFMRRNTAMLLNTLEVARTWRVRRFAVASSIGVYIGAPGPRWREDLALVPATSPNSILAFKRSVEAITPQVLQGTGVEPITVHIGTIWGPLGLADSPFFPIPRLISATVRGEAPDLTPPRPAGFADDGGDRCYVKDCGRAIALLMHADTLRHDTYNVSRGGRSSITSSSAPSMPPCPVPRRRCSPAALPTRRRRIRTSTPPASSGTPASSRPSTCGRASRTTSRGSRTTRPEPRLIRLRAG